MNLPFAAEGLTVVSGDRSRLGPDWGRRTPGDPYGRLYAVTRGRCWVLSRKQSRILRPGDLAWIPPGQPLDMGCDGPFHVDWIHVGFDGPAGDLGRGIRVAPLERTLASFYFKRAHRWLSLLRHGQSPDPEGLLILQSTLLGLLACFAKGAVENPNGLPPAAKRFETVLALVRRNPESRHSLAEMAACVHMSAAGFSRAFARAMGRSPGQYFLRARIEWAKEVLRREDRTNGRLAEAFGFVDEFHFAKTFRRLTGETPRQFRDRWAKPGL